MARPPAFSKRINGQNARMKSSVGLTSQSAVASARCSAIVLGVSSPSVMCSAVMSANAMATAMLCAGFRDSHRQGRKTRLNHDRQRRLADPAQAKARHRDAELRRRDVAGRIADRPPYRAGATMALRNQLVDARLADGHDREFGRNEKAVREHQCEDASQAPQDP